MESEFTCRLCGTAGEISATRPESDKTKYARDIHLALGVNVKNDSPSSPRLICQCCRMKLVRWRKNVNSRKKPTINISVVDNQTQQDNVSDKWKEIDKYAEDIGLVVSAGRGNRKYMKIENDTVVFSLNFENNFTFSVNAMSKKVNIDEAGLNLESGTSTQQLKELIQSVNDKRPCCGNPDFEDVCRGKSTNNLAVFRTKSGTPRAYEEVLHQSNFEKTIRTANCLMLHNPDDERCKPCSIFRAELYTMRSRIKTASATPKLQHRLDYMTEMQLKEKCINRKEEVRGLKRKVDNLTEDIRKHCEQLGVTLNSSLSESFLEIMKTNSSYVFSQFKEGSVQRVLWQQQLQASQKASLKQMRWHPAMIRFCIALHAKSPTAYRMVRNSKVLFLPHENTLRDYTKFTNVGTGWNPDIINRIKEDFSINDNEQRQHVCLLFDEVKIKSGLVYCSETGRLIGFCDLGDFNNFQLGSEVNNKDPELATHILTLMIRGLFNRMECVVAHYPCKGFNSHQLYYVIWDGVGILELAGFKVRALVCDGATPNRKFYRIHKEINGDLCHYTENMYNPDRKLYFIADVPHLMKTTRNNFENSGWNNKTKNLYFDGKPIKWSHVVRLVDDDIFGGGLRLLPRLTHEHLNLTPTLRMRVKLAVQILSSSVANALQLNGNNETKSTELFIRKFDMFFDCLNVGNITNGVFQRKPACEAYRDVNDWRFEWLEKDFLGFLQQWEYEANHHQQLTAKERKQLCLSKETLEGLRITVKSFISLGKDLLRLPYVQFLLSEKLNQDPLEEYFSKQRGMGGYCDNPTVRQFQHNALRLQVAGAPAVLASTRANCQNGNAVQLQNEPIQRRNDRK